MQGAPSLNAGSFAFPPPTLHHVSPTSARRRARSIPIPFLAFGNTLRSVKGGSRNHEAAPAHLSCHTRRHRRALRALLHEQPQARVRRSRFCDARTDQRRHVSTTCRMSSSQAVSRLPDGKPGADCGEGNGSVVGLGHHIDNRGDHGSAGTDPGGCRRR